jgi:hypothetical protein
MDSDYEKLLLHYSPKLIFDGTSKPCASRIQLTIPRAKSKNAVVDKVNGFGKGTCAGRSVRGDTTPKIGFVCFGKWEFTMAVTMSFLDDELVPLLERLDTSG